MALSAASRHHTPALVTVLTTLWASLRAWRYAESGSRDLRLDLLRGFCVFAMVVDHVGGASWLYGITGGNRWVVSAGEGFVFLSGLVAGLVYSRKMFRAGLTATTWALLRRARTLYLVTLAMTTTFVGLALWTDLTLWVDRSAGLGAEHWTGIVVGMLTLRYAYHGSDILALYTLLLLATPAILFLLREGHWRWVLFGSWGIWAGHALYPDSFAVWEIQNSLYFPIAAWQTLFVTGLVIGHARASAEQRGEIVWGRALGAAVPWVAGAVVLGASVALIRMHNPLELLPDSSFRLTGLELEPWAIGIWDKIALGPGRLAAFAVTLAVAYALLTALWAPVNRLLGWLLLPLGSGALTAYATHLLLIVIGYNLALFGSPEPSTALMNTVWQLGLVLILWAIVQLPEVLGTVRFPRSMLAPLPIHHLSRSLAGCLGAVLFLLLVAHESASSAPRTLSTPLVHSGSAAQLAPAPQSDVSPLNPSVLPPSALADELMRLGYTEAVEGPRSIALPAGQLVPRVFASPSLVRRMPYYVYLPPGYDQTDERYPVVYLLHGYYGSFIEWAEIGIHQAADQLILNGQIRPMIIVMPEGEQSYYVNHGLDGPRWADYVSRDLPREIDRTFRTIPAAEARAIGGLSMGGTGALYAAFMNPDRFGIVGAHAPTLKWERPVDKFAFADDEYFRSVNPLVLAEERDDLESLTIWLDVGAEDWDWFTVDELHATLEQREIAHDFAYLAGGHAAEYWIDHQEIFLLFYDRAFQMRLAARR